MFQLIDYLKRFNRKERFILLRHVLRQQAGDSFRLDPCFAQQLRELGIEEIPDDPEFVAMDYHLDWLQMALYLTEKNDPGHTLFLNDDLVQANQEDIDLLIAFKGTESTHLVLIEAKADTGWNNGQLESKADRFKRIFDKDFYGNEPVKPHFILMSPSRPKKVRTCQWPSWMRAEGQSCPLWLKLCLSDKLLKVTRWDEDGEKADKEGDHLLIRAYKCGRWVEVDTL